MKINSILDDQEIESCIDGHSNIRLIREIIDLSQSNNLLDLEDFADMFSYRLREFIGVSQEEDEDAYDEAYINNWEWGMRIAENINHLLVDKWTKL